MKRIQSSQAVTAVAAVTDCALICAEKFVVNVVDRIGGMLPAPGSAFPSFRNTAEVTPRTVARLTPRRTQPRAEGATPESAVVWTDATEERQHQFPPSEPSQYQ